MNFTGERPTMQAEMRSSRMRYKTLIPYIFGCTVYDYGCGIGHGSYLLARYARSVIGYDVCKEAIEEARTRFSYPNLRFTDKFEISEWGSASVFVAVESIEHLERTELEMLISTVSKNTGAMLVTTPNGDQFPYHPATIAERRGFHVWHYTYKELQDLFGKYFPYVVITGHCFDPAFAGGHFTGYTVFASDQYGWAEEMWMNV